jgi:Phosphate-selective porin O and P.
MAAPSPASPASRRRAVPALFLTALAASGLGDGLPACAQASGEQKPAEQQAVPAASLRVLPSDHFSYEVMRRFGQAGWIEGYPAGTDVIQGRILTRFEMASLVARHLTRLGNLARLPESEQPDVPADDLRLSLRLAREFQRELVAMGYDFKRAAAMVPEVADLADGAIPPEEVAQAKSTLSRIVVNSREGDEEGLLSRLENRVSGYFQFRYDSLIGPGALFNAAGDGGDGQRPSGDGPSVGGPRSGFAIRRGRLKVSDRFTERDEFTFQIDLPSNSSPNVRDAFVRVFDFPAKNFAMRFGQYAFPYGFEHIASSRFRETPERALGFSDSTQASFLYKTRVSDTGGVVTPGSVLPFFVDQDRDIGVELAWAAPEKEGAFTPRASFNVLQGEGRAGSGQRSLNNVYDIMGSVEAVRERGLEEMSFGLSFYNGTLSVRSAAPDAEGNLAPFRYAKRAFGGAYARYRTERTEVRGEYSGGLYEVTPDRALFADGNRFQAWYVAARQFVAPKVELYAKYDEFHPVRGNTMVAGVRGADLARKTLQVGAMWHATEGTRFRVNYGQGFTRYDASAPEGSPLRDKLGLLQIEVQQVF